jgi:predicted methyltransferase
MKKRLLAWAVPAMLLARSACADTPEYLVDAVRDPDRPESDRQRDVDRKPEQVIAFAGIKPGDKVADFMPGRGYFTRILCKLVGDAGHVYAISVPRNVPAGSRPANSAPSSPTTESPQSCSNVTASTLQMQKRPAPELWSSSDDPGGVYEYWSFSPPAENFAAPELLDVIWTSENYHDLHNPGFGSPNMQLVNRALLKALKPGGMLLIEDHAAVADSGARDTGTLHRIDPEQVKVEVTAAGFEFIGASDVLRHREDSHTVKAHDMHDKTDRFLLKFRKPE